MDRSKLPYRKNCEGYFVYNKKYVLARDTGLGYLEFPGGGVDHDDISDAMQRETLEETGAIIAELKLYKKVYFDWDEHWAKTPKQKHRYKMFRGEEMHLFTGVVKQIDKALGDPETGEAGWLGEPYIEIQKAIKLTNSFRPFRDAMVSYHEEQLKILKSLMEK